MNQLIILKKIQDSWVNLFIKKRLFSSLLISADESCVTTGEMLSLFGILKRFSKGSFLHVVFLDIHSD